MLVQSFGPEHEKTVDENMIERAYIWLIEIPRRESAAFSDCGVNGISVTLETVFPFQPLAEFFALISMSIAST